MPQMQWTYVADTGVPYKVQLYHGGVSGHVMVSINSKVSIVDFFVKDSKNYTLFIEDEIFLLELERNEKGFGYAFTMDKGADTAKNIQRRKVARKQNMTIAIGAIIFAGVFILGVLKFQQYQDDKLTLKSLPYLEELGLATLGRVSGLKDGRRQIYYTAGKNIYDLPVEGVPGQIPVLATGDDLVVYYLPAKPKIARVAWFHPGPRRSDRLFSSWSTTVLEEATDPNNPLWTCIFNLLKADRQRMTDHKSPWHTPSVSSFQDWIFSQPELVMEIRDQCGLDGL
jgi:hypothetical protein